MKKCHAKKKNFWQSDCLSNFVFSIVVFFIDHYCAGVSNKHCLLSFFSSLKLCNYFLQGSDVINTSENCSRKQISSECFLQESDIINSFKNCSKKQIYVLSNYFLQGSDIINTGEANTILL